MSSSPSDPKKRRLDTDELIEPSLPKLANYSESPSGPLTSNRVESADDSNLGVLLGDLLVSEGVLTREEVESNARLAGLTQQRLGELLVDSGLLDERQLYRALAAQRGLPFARFDELIDLIDMQIVDAAPRAFLRHNQLIPLARVEEGIVVITPEPLAAFDELENVFTDTRVLPHLVTPTDFRRFWTAIEVTTSDDGTEYSPRQLSSLEAIDLLKKHSQPDERIVTLFEALLLDAIGERASDIHFERYNERVRIRLRVDGELFDLGRYHITPAELLGLINIIKIRASLDISERRRPQGGRYSVRVGGRPFDLRVQTQPTLHGEHIVIRLLPQKTELTKVEHLGFSKQVREQYRRLLRSPAGLVLVVGPTGSGKSTTLYAGLQELAADHSRKVITIEDPIEYSLENVQQSQTRSELGFNFADAMRVFVRQDPDVILVGEIRDSETALEAIRASQTGHLVLSTLHCNDATDAVQRLVDLGMHENSIASELLAVLAQRLARRICEECREETTPDPEIMRELFPNGDVPEDFRCFAGKGCRNCHERGVRGRVAVAEFLLTRKAMRLAISNRIPVGALRDRAIESGMIPMRDSALALVMSGTIPLTEMPRILPPEKMATEKSGN